jgi:hypothetical protein
VKKVLSMKFSAGIPAVLVLAALLFAAGCSSTGGGQATPAPTAPPTPVQTQAVLTTPLPTTGTGGSTQPGPTQTIPASEAVSISIEKAGTYSTTIIAHFDGGKGINFVSRIDVRVTRPDGSVVTGILKPMMGDTLEIEGTNGDDRIEVVVTMKSGNVYKVIDQIVPYKTRG